MSWQSKTHTQSKQTCSCSQDRLAIYDQEQSSLPLLTAALVSDWNHLLHELETYSKAAALPVLEVTDILNLQGFNNAISPCTKYLATKIMEENKKLSRLSKSPVGERLESITGWDTVVCISEDKVPHPLTQKLWMWDALQLLLPGHCHWWSGFCKAWL